MESDTEKRRPLGRTAMPPELRRSEAIRIFLRPGEAADLQALADQWDVPKGLALWAIVSDQISHWRAIEPNLGRVGLAIAASADINERLRRTDAERKRAEQA